MKNYFLFALLSIITIFSCNNSVSENNIKINPDKITKFISIKTEKEKINGFIYDVEHCVELNNPTGYNFSYYKIYRLGNKIKRVHSIGHNGCLIYSYKNFVPHKCHSIDAEPYWLITIYDNNAYVISYYMGAIFNNISNYRRYYESGYLKEYSYIVENEIKLLKFNESEKVIGNMGGFYNILNERLKMAETMTQEQLNEYVKTL